MIHPAKILITAALLLALTSGCTPQNEEQPGFSGASFQMVNQQGENIQFPDDFAGSPVLIGFIYTHCPDICSIITARLHQVWDEMDRSDEVQFVIATFDPERDTPDVLLDYARNFGMDNPPFTFLTGEPTEVERLMEMAGVRSEISERRETESGDPFYLIDHTDNIMLLDEDGRLVMDYGGSMTPTHILVEDLEEIL